MNRQRKRSFVFIIPVRNPIDDKVSDYGCIEAVLRETVRSLTQQTYANVQVLIVCHRIPDWSTDFGDHVTFLDVSDITVFPANKNPVKIDKGLKYIIGILYANAILNPAMIMPMDADDYINIELAARLMKQKIFIPHKDGYLITKGLHVSLKLTSQHLIEYKAAYSIERFDRTCGSCRIFKTSILMNKLIDLAPEIEEKFRPWSPRSPQASVKVSAAPVEWLSGISKSTYHHEDSIVNILGRHIKQDPYFKFSPLTFIGAAKGCGHGNHDGPRQGEIHQDKLIDKFSISAFCEKFGLIS